MTTETKIASMRIWGSNSLKERRKNTQKERFSNLGDKHRKKRDKNKDKHHENEAVYCFWKMLRKWIGQWINQTGETVRLAGGRKKLWQNVMGCYITDGWFSWCVLRPVLASLKQDLRVLRYSWGLSFDFLDELRSENRITWSLCKPCSEP